MKKTRNGSIDFWRFIFAVCIVIFHASILDVNKTNSNLFILGRGAIGVEFFFLTSGFLMAVSVNKNSGKDNVLDFMKNKIKGIYPAILLSWIFSFTLINIFYFKDFYTLITRMFESVWELLFLRNAGFNGFRTIPQTWYISAMFLSMFIIFPIYNKNKEKFEGYIAPLLSIIILGYLFHFTNSLVNPNKYMILFYKSSYRAFGEICLGIFCYHICKQIKNINFTKIGELLLSFLELFGYIFTIYYMQSYKLFNSTFDFVVLVMLGISITISFSQKSIISKLFNFKIFNFLGRYSLYIYLTYYAFAKILPVILVDKPIDTIYNFYLLLTFLSAIILMFLEKYFIKFLKIIRKLLVNNS